MLKRQVLVHGRELRPSPHPGGPAGRRLWYQQAWGDPRPISMALTQGHLEGVGDFGRPFLLFRATWAPQACRQGWRDER